MKHKENQIRVIAGKWRGRRLSFPNIQDLRPTPDRVRETLFNWLTHYIVGARCLDLFAGSGALSFEALSRGAAYVCAVEQNPMVGAALREAREAFGVDQSMLELVVADGLSWLMRTPPIPFDIVFLDPPYTLKLLLPCIRLLQEKGWLKSQSLIYCEHDQPLDAELFPASDWDVLKTKQAGRVFYALVMAK